MEDSREATSESAEEASAASAGGSPGWFVSRRRFLRTGTLSAAAVGVMASVPGLPGLFQTAEADAPASAGAVTEAESAAPEVEGPIVAHITNASAGQVSLYVGERQIVYNDRALVQRLLQASKP